MAVAVGPLARSTALPKFGAPRAGLRPRRHGASKRSHFLGCAPCWRALKKSHSKSSVAIDTGPPRAHRGVPKVFWLSAGTVTWTAIFLAVGARRKPRDQHRDNKTLVSSDSQRWRKPARTHMGSYTGTAECVSPTPAGDSGPHRGKLGEIGRDRRGARRPGGEGRAGPTGIARERETRTDDAGPANLTWSAGLRPASRGSAKPAPTTLVPPTLHVRLAGPASLVRVSRSRAMPVGDRRSTGDWRGQRRRCGFRAPARCRSETGAPRETGGASVVGAGFALPRDAGRRPALHVRLAGPASLVRVSRSRATTLAPPVSRGAPVSDRHRAGARNPHRRR